MKILFLTFYFEPDLCAGSFRNAPLAHILSKKLSNDDSIEVITTKPNRYQSYSIQAPSQEHRGNMTVHRVQIAAHKNGFKDQIISFWTYYRKVHGHVNNRSYDMVYASSSRLFTAYLGSLIARKKKIPLYLDIRDIFTENIKEIIPKYYRTPLMTLLKAIEKSTFSSADHINLVSMGFSKYFEKYQKPTYSWFTNGIDQEFINGTPKAISYANRPLVITYAGNLGEGQGLHKIIPEAAKLLGSRFKFRIIGDGGCKMKLEHATEGLNNVEIIPPVDRERLKQYYQDSHFLFLHLNDYQAFESVLPSKIFEYAASSKPIFAGVGGFAAQFVKKHLPDAVVFSPNDVTTFVEKMLDFKQIHVNRDDFIKEFGREHIMDQMADTILQLQG